MRGTRARPGNKQEAPRKSKLFSAYNLEGSGSGLWCYTWSSRGSSAQRTATPTHGGAGKSATDMVGGGYLLN
jgi:hypothetical protein